MPPLHAIVLGALQGLSEFLPISSSGHLHIARWFLGWEELSKSSSAAFDVAVHVGTLSGALAYLRSDVIRYSKAALNWLTKSEKQPLNPDERVAFAIAVSVLPAAFFGLLLGEVLWDLIRIEAIAVALIMFGLLLGWADRYAQKRESSLGVQDFGIESALLLGLAQVLALYPGVSRSGITITMARFRGFKREDSARIAFLVGLPVIAGAGLYGLIGLEVPEQLWPGMALGAITAAITGWAAVWGTVCIAVRTTFKPFVFYRVAVGLVVLSVILFNQTL